LEVGANARAAARPRAGLTSSSTANALDIKISDNLLSLADEVIE
jgi:hypothetical protein